MKIPRDRAKEVIGRGGFNIKEMQVKTETEIKARDELETEDYRVVSIRGSPESTQKAEILIQETLAQRRAEISVVSTVSTVRGMKYLVDPPVLKIILIFSFSKT